MWKCFVLGDVMMIEGDIRLLGEGTGNVSQVPVMAHDVGDFNNITFQQWLDEIIQVFWNVSMHLTLGTLVCICVYWHCLNYCRWTGEWSLT